MKKTKLNETSYFIGEKLTLGKNISVGSNCVIRATDCTIGDNVRLGNNNSFLVGRRLEIGDNSIFENNNDITCLEASFGEYLFLDSNVVIGHGGKFNYDSTIRIGKQTMICAYTKLNVNFSIDIGDGVGIGEYVDIWTHGSYLPVLKGFPAQFGPVKIGSNVWIPAKSTVMPNVEIGDNVVIGVNSLINKSLPAGCLAAGIPARVLRENVYPSKDLERNAAIIEKVVAEYKRLADFKNLKVDIKYDRDNFCLIINGVTFDLEKMIVESDLDDVQEDFRDFLRRRGIKFYNGSPFKSVLPDCYRKLLDCHE